MDDKYKRKPYESRFKPQLDQLYSKLQNREPFQYDVNGDALYQMYKNQAVSGGKLAMQDTMGNAQAMTGGYGNTYAQNVGQQAYNGYMLGMAGKIPELARNAYDMYEREGDKIKGQIGMLEGLEGKDYDRYIDERNMAMQDEDRAIRDREAAYSRIMQLMQLGYKPSGKEAAAAGLTSSQIDAIWDRLNPVFEDGGIDYGVYSGAPGKKPTGPLTFEEKYNTMLKSGATDQQLHDFVADEVANNGIGYDRANAASGMYGSGSGMKRDEAKPWKEKK